VGLERIISVLRRMRKLALLNGPERDANVMNRMVTLIVADYLGFITK
jgi:hypothetical protein